MENNDNTQIYLNLVETELLKQRDVYLALKEGCRDSVCYKAYQDKEWGTQDANYTGRLRLSYYLLYEKEGDEKTIAWLFEEELKDREQNSFQGIGAALEILTFLLKKYNAGHKYDDLFARAKNANFDCACGYSAEITLSETLSVNDLLDCIFLCQDLEYKTVMEVLVAQWKDSVAVWDDGKRAELIQFYTFLGKKKENETLYLEQLNSAKQTGELSDVVSAYSKLIRYYLDLEKIEIAHKYLDEARGRMGDKTKGRSRLFEHLFEEAFEIIYLEQEGRENACQEEKKETCCIPGTEENTCQKQWNTERTKELWQWARQEMKGVTNWYGNLYKKAIAAAKAMGDPCAAQLEKKYESWKNNWNIS